MLRLGRVRRAALAHGFAHDGALAELQALVDRWQVVEYLEQGLPYRRIHELTGVSVTTIGRVARFLSDGFGGYQAAIKRTHNSH